MGNQGRILVTGGSGFLGASLCERLVQAGHEVICLDNLLTSSIDNIEHLLGSGNFKFIEHDVTEPIRLEVDEIYNLACPASPIHYQANPIKTMKTSECLGHDPCFGHWPNGVGRGSESFNQ